jgi:hypothetical protein
VEYLVVVDTADSQVERLTAGLEARYLILPNGYPEHHTFTEVGEGQGGGVREGAGASLCLSPSVPTIQAWRSVYPEAKVISPSSNIKSIAEYFLNSEVRRARPWW